MIGVYVCPIVYVAHETGSPLEGATKSLQRLVNMGFCTYDEDAELVWVHEMARYQIGDELKASDNRVKDIQKQYENLPEGPIKSGFFEKYGRCFHLVEHKPLASPFAGPPKPEAEAGTGTGTVSKHANACLSADGSADPPVQSETKPEKLPPCPHKEIIALWGKHLPHLTQPRIWEGARLDAMRSRWSQAAKPSSFNESGYSTTQGGVTWWDSFFAYIATTKLAKGFENNGRHWKPDLEWVLKQANFQKIIDGRYEK
jgi:hypothetical protein